MGVRKSSASPVSAVAPGATLKRWYNIEDIRFFERHPSSAGIWYINTYPGPSRSPNWTRLMSSRTELIDIWWEDANRWMPWLRELNSTGEYTHEIFHSARWDHNVDLEGKNVVIIPALISQTKHWIIPTARFIYPRVLQWISHHVPFAMRLLDLAPAIH
ncbi:hypothetical protein BDW67DRAFT_178321 [Aspergillus spinulosporus]